MQKTQTLGLSIGLLVLRLGMGGYMLTHGWGKLQRLMAGNFEFSDPIGLGPAVSLILVVFAEFFCALLIMIGLATRLACIPLIFAMAVAAFVAHGSDPWTMAGGAQLYFAGEATGWGSKQPALMYLIAFLAIALTGPGSLAVDRWLGGCRLCGCFAGGQATACDQPDGSPKD